MLTTFELVTASAYVGIVGSSCRGVGTLCVGLLVALLSGTHSKRDVAVNIALMSGVFRRSPAPAIAAALPERTSPTPSTAIDLKLDDIALGHHDFDCAFTDSLSPTTYRRRPPRHHRQDVDVGLVLRWTLSSLCRRLDLMTGSLCSSFSLRLTLGLWFSFDGGHYHRRVTDLHTPPAFVDVVMPFFSTLGRASEYSSSRHASRC
ncbi:hypothetical protein BDZ89DRAFT_1129527 [Hymenopellis radicata]|nr:hypothetical protein BDZ89DRAFT_1129527 [Hymenopellis radicata]